MKKIFFALIFTLIFSAYAYGEATVTVSTTESFDIVSTEYNESDDVYTYTVAPNTFTSVKNALEFASNPNNYVSSNLGSNYIIEDESIYQDITITLSNPSLGGEISLSNYSLNSIIINGGGNTITTSYDREFKLDNSEIAFTLNSVTINGNSSNAGIQIDSIGSATLNSVTFRNIKSSANINGGAVTISGGNNIAFNSCRFSSNQADNGGAVYVSGGNGITFNGCSFSGNTSTYGGGAMYIAGGSNFTFSGSNSFSGNTAGTNGGAIGVSSSSASPTFSGITFDGTNQAQRGGAVYVVGGATFNGGTAFNSSSADMGGALYIVSGTVNVESDVTFSGNKANDGGVIYVSGGNLHSYSDIEGDGSTANASNGGAIYVSGGTANIYGSINGNAASNAGGALYIAGGTVNINTSTDISNNTAIYGGAIYIIGRSSKLAVNAGDTVSFTSNSASSAGGAIYIDSSASSSALSFSSEVKFTENYVTDGNGGALWLGSCGQLPSGTLAFESNQAQRTDTTDNTIGNGGAIYIGDSTLATATLDSSYNYTFTGNIAYAYGGAFYTLSSDVIFDGLTMTDKNTANVGGGFASSGSGRFTIRNGSTISNQTAPTGGAIYAIGSLTLNDVTFSENVASLNGGAIYGEGEIIVESADFSNNESQGTNNNNGGGAIYASGTLTLTDSIFSGNVSNQDGGAVYGNNNEVTVTNSYFDSNSTTRGNGGGVMLTNASTLTVTQSTFTNNKSGYDGGAFYAQGETLEIEACYFEENQAAQHGGAVYFDQSSGSPSNSHFSIITSMLRYNSAAGESGGGLHIATNTASIKRCTFDNNVISGTGYGAGVYLDTTVVGESASNTIENCTFTSNIILNGNSSASGGGGLAVACEQTAITFCTFTMNDSTYKGGGIYVKTGKVTLSGTLAVGNNSNGVYDVWVDDSIESGGYNRIGVYGQGSGVTNFSSVTRNDSDVTGYPSKNWSKETFFTDNELDVNEISSSVPPVIGSTLTTQERLLTIMLNEEETLPTNERATNIIPYSARSRFPNIDERGVTRILTSQSKLDIGAVFFDGTRDNGGEDENDSYTISYIQMSGIPNELRHVGQSAALISKIYYTNGRSVYGGSGDGEEAVTWESDKPTIVSINSDTGVATALRVTTGEAFVTITVKTVRTSDDGTPYSDSKLVKVVEELENNLNVSPNSNSETANYIKSMKNEFTEYNIGYGFNSTTASTVSSSSFQASFANTWGDSAILSSAAVSDSNTEVSQYYETSDKDYKASKSAAMRINYSVENQNSNLVSLNFPFDYSGEELEKLIGHNASGVKFDADFAKELFKVLRIEFQGSNGAYVVVGEGGNIDIDEAVSCGALKFESIDNGKGVRVILNAAIANTDYENSTDIQDASTDYKGPQIISGVLVVPDGLKDDAIYGSMWAAEKTSSSSSSSENNQKPSAQTSQQNQNSNSSSSGENGGGGGGSCNSLGLGIFAGTLIFALKQKRK